MAQELLITLSITPHFDQIGAATSLSLLYTICRPDARAGGTLFIFEEADELGQRNHGYEEHDVIAFDSAGPFFLDFRPVQGRPDLKAWVVSRDTYGDVNVQLQVQPRVSDFQAHSQFLPLTPLGTVHGVQALQKDQGGLIGSGRWFLPLVVASGYRGRRCTIDVVWDLDAGPPRTRAICSFGEGPASVMHIGDAATLLDSVFMVGPVKSWPELGGQVGAGAGPSATVACQTFWFGDLPANIVNVKDYCSNIFPSVSHFFKDEKEGYRLFLQKVEGGSEMARGFTSSSIVSYGARMSALPDFHLVRLLNHQMIYCCINVHAGPDQGGNVWFNRGFSLLYTVFLPFRFKERGPDYFRESLNNFLSAYYTNPLLHSSLRHPGQAATLGGWYYQAMQYTRGFLYALKMDAYSRWASRETKTGIARPIDNIIADLSQRWRRGESVTVTDFLSELSRWLGKEHTLQLFNEMLEGKVLDMADMQDSFGDRHRPVPVEQEILSFGFDFPGDASTGVLDMPFTVSGVVPGSRAQLAGLMDGDTVVDCDGLTLCLTNLQCSIRFVVERQRRLFDIEYWPRSWIKVVSWQVLERGP